MTSIPTLVGCAAWFTSLHVSTAKLTNICDAKTAAVYAIANNAAQTAYVLMGPAPENNLLLTIGASLTIGYLGGTLATKALCQREISIKEACIMTGGSFIQGAIYGVTLGILTAWMMDNQFADVPLNATV